DCSSINWQRWWKLGFEPAAAGISAATLARSLNNGDFFPRSRNCPRNSSSSRRVTNARSRRYRSARNEYAPPNARTTARKVNTGNRNGGIKGFFLLVAHCAASTGTEHAGLK